VPAAVLAAALVALGRLLGWQGVDTAAQVYRVDSFRHRGFVLWDPSWYGGHWTLDYSVLYPPLASTLGMLTVTIVSAAVAALAFDRLARRPLGPGGPAASYLFAAGTLVSASIGQLTFLTGEAFGLPALWAAGRGRYRTAAILALACTLTSPLTGAFLALAAVAWTVDLVNRRPAGRDRRWIPTAGLAAVAAVPIVVVAVLFPGDGPMPYPATDWLWEMAVAAAVGLLAGRRYRAVAAGAALFAAAATISELVPSALGGNVGRLEDMVALPLAVGLLWPRLPALIPLAAVPLALSQWSPAWGAFTSAPSARSTQPSFYAPLATALRSQAASGPAGRVEVVPTAWHWEAVYVAADMALARGWERQLDEADNPIFYEPGRLDPDRYRTWLLDNGVRFVALPSAPLDMAGQAEGRLVASGRVPGLRLVWHDQDWRLYAVQGSPGIVSGPAELMSASGGQVVLDARGGGTVTVRVRWSPDWFVAGDAGCVSRDGSWVSVVPAHPGPISLQLSVLAPGRSACPPARRGGPTAAGDN
jgi:hypothetical protein